MLNGRPSREVITRAGDNTKHVTASTKVSFPSFISSFEAAEERGERRDRCWLGPLFSSGARPGQSLVRNVSQYVTITSAAL